MLDRRNDSRNLCSDIVELQWYQESGEPVRTHALMEDISIDGACLQSEIKISPGTAVEICLDDSRLLAKVRYCTLIDHGYFVGVQFEEGVKWEPDSMFPRHLLDPSHLAAGPPH